MNARLCWNLLSSQLHPMDVPVDPTWPRIYMTLFDIVASLQPRHIVEIGVRCGYSAFTMACAAPRARTLGIEKDGDRWTEDTHGGERGLWQWADHLMRPFDYQLVLADSRNIRRLPMTDLVYVDGDHSFDGALADLELANLSTNTILVDDYSTAATVSQACRQFLDTHTEYVQTFYDNGSTGVLLLRR